MTYTLWPTSTLQLDFVIYDTVKPLYKGCVPGSGSNPFYRGSVESRLPCFHLLLNTYLGMGTRLQPVAKGAICINYLLG